MSLTFFTCKSELSEIWGSILQRGSSNHCWIKFLIKLGESISKWWVDQQVVSRSASGESISKWWVDQQVVSRSASGESISKWCIASKMAFLLGKTKSTKVIWRDLVDELGERELAGPWWFCCLITRQFHRKKVGVSLVVQRDEIGWTKEKPISQMQKNKKNTHKTASTTYQPLLWGKGFGGVLEFGVSGCVGACGWMAVLVATRRGGE